MPAPAPQPDPRQEALRLLARFVAKAIREGWEPAVANEEPAPRRAFPPIVVKEAS
jgi:hypothetical protein